LHFTGNHYIIIYEKKHLAKGGFAMGDVALLILICAMGAYAFYDDLFT